MRTVTFKSVLEWVASKALGHPSLMGQEEAETFTRYINDAVRECWEREPWPEWSPVMERFYADAYADGTYPLGATVYFNGSYYTTTAEINDAALAAAGGAIPPLSEEVLFGLLGGGDLLLAGGGGSLLIQEDISALYWEASTDVEQLLPVEDFGTVLGVYQRDPFTYRNTPDLGYVFTPAGLHVFGSAPTSAWIHYRLPPPEFTANTWEVGSYAIGDKVYYRETGECYEAIAAATTQLPTDTTRWEKIDFPYVLSRAVQRFAYADALEDDGQADKAIRQREDAEEALALEWTKSEGQQNQARRFTVLSR